MTGAPVPVIVPVKALRLAKRRLASALTATERRQLVLAMLADVLDTLAAVPSAGPVLVVTPDPDVAALAEAKHAAVLVDKADGGLNAAVRQGLGDRCVQAAGRALVVPGDVPLASAGEIARVAGSIAPGRQRVVLVPSRDGDGTNALLLAPPGVIEPAFGPDSFFRHLAAAVARGADAEILQLDGLATDIDMPGDLDCLIRARSWSPRYDFLRARAGPAGNAATIVQENRR